MVDAALAGLLGALRLASPALPIGAYAYSRGLEGAVALGWVHNETSAHVWIEGVLTHQLATLDAPVLARLHAAFDRNDTTAVSEWNQLLCAARETREIELEDRQLGQALARLLHDLGLEGADAWRAQGAYATLFALACVRLGVDVQAAVLAFLFAFLEGQVTASAKLIPLGQTAGQRVLAALAATLPATVQRVLALHDDDIGATTPGLAIASALHETQDARLYRS